MFNFSLIYEPDTQKYLDYHKELLKKAEHERLVQEAMQAKETKPKTSRTVDWLYHLSLHLRNIPHAKQTSQVQT